MSERSDDPLTPNERSQFRRMADHPEVVEEVIDTSDDATPASRRRVLDEINRKRQAPPPEMTEEERWEAELTAGDRRAARRLTQAVEGWDQLVHFRDYQRREQVLALLDPVHRRVLAEIEERLHA